MELGGQGGVRSDERGGIRPGGARPRRWRAIGAAFLACLPFAIASAAIEVLLADRRNPATLLDLLYGVNIHFLLALLAVLAASVLSRRAGGTLPLISLIAFAFVEATGVISYWILAAPWAPRFSSLAGKLFALAVVLGSGAMVLAGGWLLSRRRGKDRWIRWAQSSIGVAGLTIATILVLGNGWALARGWPRPEPSAVRPDALAKTREDLIIILVDTLRRDHLSFFGYDRPTSPNIDRLLNESYVFTAGYTPSNRTVPSIASLFTGLYPTSCRIHGPYDAIPRSALTLAEHFRSYGYRTGGFIANRVITAQGGYAQGFETYFPRSAPWWTYRRRTAIEQIAQRIRAQRDCQFGWRVNAEFLAWLDGGRGESPQRPLFAYIHYMEPHSPYKPNPEDLAAVTMEPLHGPAIPPLFHNYGDETVCNDWECLTAGPLITDDHRRAMIDRYDGEVHEVDRHIGDLLKALAARGVLDRAHLLFLSDHGEQFGDHSGWYHGHAIYDELILAPMAYRPPGGLAQAMRISRPAAMLDVMRSLIERVGLERPILHQGRRISELLATPSDASVSVPRSVVLAELPPNLYGLRLGCWKLVRRGPPQEPVWRLFDLDSDPSELNDLAPVFPDTLETMRGLLNAMLAGYAEQGFGRNQISLDGEMLKQLRDLGYIR